jgi:hypothetical protein
MNPTRSVARFAALALGAVAAASCDTRMPTSSTTNPVDDIERPQISFTLSAGANNIVDLGTPLTVTVKATDNGGVASMLTVVRNAAQVIGVDTITVAPTQTSVSRVVPVPLGGLARGDRLTIRSTVSDGSLNTKIDSIVVTIADTAGASITVSSSKGGRALKGGDTLDVRVSASDSSGIAYAGYRLLRIRATDSVLVRAESAFVAAGTRPTVFTTPPFAWVLPDTLLTGSYTIVGTALDRSGVASRGGAVSFTVVDGTKPSLVFVSPTLGASLNVGDSILVTARLTDNVALKSVSFRAVSPRGNPAFGTADTVVRYAPLTATFSGAVTVRDTLLRRYLKVLSPIDLQTDSLLITGVLVDGANNADTVSVMGNMVNGPIVTFISPIRGDSASAGTGLTVALKGTSPLGVLKLGFRLRGDASWGTPLDTTVTVVYSPAPKSVTMQATIRIPAGVPPKSIITITPISVDVAGQDGSSSSATIAIRAGTIPAPRVSQQIDPRVEVNDSITVTAVGDAITYVGYELRDAANVRIKRDSVAVTGGPSTSVRGIGLALSPSIQGKRVALISFAYDQNGRVGYSLRSGLLTPQPAASLAHVDSSLVVYGRTYALPATRTGTIADLAVDPVRGNVFLSNVNHGRLEVWQKGTQSFDPTGVVVGSQPWGMTMSRTAASKDTLYVANSGGTNLSRVYVGGATASAMKEDLGNRLLTRVSFMFKLTEVRDQSTGKIRITVSAPILFSDRPQFVEQSSSGRLYISTKPTAAAPLGTVRYLDPAAPAPDERFILAFATPGTDNNSWLLANIDDAGVTPSPATSTASDLLTLCDHPSGSTAAATCVSSTSGIQATIDLLRTTVPQTDIDYGVNLDETSLGLSDTTFAASSGDGQWITFGEGNTKRAFGRDFLLRDDGTVPNKYTYASPAINVADLINNAADKVFGIALDKTGKTLGIHGAESYFASVSQPFTQRLQGKKSTFSRGAGIAFHPNADGTTSPAADRLAFVASANGSIEMVDIAHYDFGRGQLATKFNLYGPLRASLPFPGDDASVVFKLFGLSPTGLVVIDVTAADIAPGP